MLLLLIKQMTPAELSAPSRIATLPLPQLSLWAVPGGRTMPVSNTLPGTSDGEGRERQRLAGPSSYGKEREKSKTQESLLRGVTGNLEDGASGRRCDRGAKFKR